MAMRVLDLHTALSSVIQWAYLYTLYSRQTIHCNKYYLLHALLSDTTTS